MHVAALAAGQTIVQDAGIVLPDLQAQNGAGELGEGKLSTVFSLHPLDIAFQNAPPGCILVFTATNSPLPPGIIHIMDGFPSLPGGTAREPGPVCKHGAGRTVLSVC